MWNCRKCEVCGTSGSVEYVERRKCEKCGTSGRVNYVELQEV